MPTRKTSTVFDVFAHLTAKTSNANSQNVDNVYF